MKLIPAKCPSCGAEIVDQNQRPCYPNKTETSTGDIIEGSRVEIYKSSKSEYKYMLKDKP